MMRPADLLVVGATVSAVVWLNVPKLLLPALGLALGIVSILRWRREGREPLAAERYRGRLLASAVVIAAISVPLIVQIVPPNGVYGFRTSLTRGSVDIWYSANAFMGWALLFGAAVSATAVTRLPAHARRELLLAVFLLPLLGAVAASFAYLNQLT